MSKKISIILFTMLLIIGAFWIWSFSSSKKSIILGGSTSVNPFMQKITKKYYATKKIEFIYNSTGSQAGVWGVENDMYKIGFISKNINDKTLNQKNKFLNLNEEQNNLLKQTSKPFEKIEIPNKSKKRNNSFVALQIAIDAIGIIYNPPKYWETEIKISNDINLSLNDLINFNINIENKEGKKIIEEIYNGNKTWNELAQQLIGKYKNSDNQIEKDLYEKFNNYINQQTSSKIITYTREDGSGTRSAFTDLTKVKNMSSSNVVNSNFSMIDQIAKSSGFGYISKGFLIGLTNEGPVKLAGIDNYKLPIGKSEIPLQWKNFKWEKWEKPNINTNESLIETFIKEAYTFKRKFIAIFNTYSSKYNQIMDLFDFINKQADEIFTSEGLVKNMLYEWIDYNLEEN